MKTQRSFDYLRFCWFIVFAFALISSPSTVLAHPGHSLGDASLSHSLTSLDHLAMIALSGGLMLIGAHFIRSEFRSRTRLRNSGAGFQPANDGEKNCSVLLRARGQDARADRLEACPTIARFGAIALLGAAVAWGIYL